MDGKFRPRGKGFRPKPVKVGEEIELDIIGIGSSGDGLGKKDGFVIFVPGTKEGDHVKVKITKVTRNVAFGETI